MISMSRETPKIVDARNQYETRARQRAHQLLRIVLVRKTIRASQRLLRKACENDPMPSIPPLAETALSTRFPGMRTISSFWMS